MRAIAAATARVRNLKAEMRAVRGGVVVVNKTQAQRKGSTVVRGGQTLRESLNNLRAAAFNSVQVGRLDVPEVRSRRIFDIRGATATETPRELPHLVSPFLKRRTEIKKDIETKMLPTPKEKRYFGIVKSTKGGQVLADVSPAGDADSWSAYFPKETFKERLPKVGEEFEYTVTTFGEYSIARVKLLPVRPPKRDAKDFGIDEKALLEWAANLNV